MAITSKSGFWNNAYAFIDGRSPLERNIARKMNKRGFRDVRELMLTLMGVVPGSAAVEQYKRVTQPATPSDNITKLGGLRTVETVDLVNRNTVVGDVTQINATVLAFSPNPASFPVNKDGNPRRLAGG